jgi:hypothetical protein
MSDPAAEQPPEMPRLDPPFPYKAIAFDPDHFGAEVFDRPASDEG